MVFFFVTPPFCQFIAHLVLVGGQKKTHHQTNVPCSYKKNYRKKRSNIITVNNLYESGISFLKKICISVDTPRMYSTIFFLNTHQPQGEELFKKNFF